MPKRSWLPKGHIGGAAQEPKPLPRLHGIDALRGLAASMIVVFHVVGINKMPLPGPLSFVSSYFGLGVPLFFIISAFSLFYTYARRMNGGADVSAYLIRRFARIAPLFYSMLAVWLLTLRYKLGQGLHPPEVLANLTFIFNFIPSWETSIVWAGWSIGVEFLFYLILPMLIAFGQGTRKALLLLALAIGVAWSFQNGPGTGSYPFFKYAPFFALGIIAWSIFDRPLELWVRRITGLSCLAAAIAAIALMVSPGPIRKLLWTAGYQSVEFYLLGAVLALIVYSQALYPIGPISNRVTRFLGEISFSLYLLHPWLIFMLKPAYIFLASKFSPGMCFFVSTLFTFVILTPLAWVAYRIVEVPGMALGKRWTQRRSEFTAGRLEQAAMPVALPRKRSGAAAPLEPQRS
jgi:peptidoglycan/LPS O-acetylase OafA/YrhL